MATKQRLMSELKGLEKEKWVNVDLKGDALFKWSLGLMIINQDSAWDGAYFKCEMGFTENYPFSPPTFKFVNPIYHPNIYPDGRVCISILHAPGEDEQSGELASERWSSVQSVESVLRSILLLLDDPEIGSPANVDAGILYRDNREEYNKKAGEAVQASKKDIPAGFVMPTTLVEAPPVKMADDDDFWNESGDEDDFGASDSSGEDQMDEDEEDGDGEEQEESEEDKEGDEDEEL